MRYLILPSYDFCGSCVTEPGGDFSLSGEVVVGLNLHRRNHMNAGGGVVDSINIASLF